MVMNLCLRMGSKTQIQNLVKACNKRKQKNCESSKNIVKLV